MTLSRKRFVTIGAVVFVIGVLVTFPARVAFQWFAGDVVQAAGISGTIWRGQANVIESRGVALTNLNWTMQPMQLFLGRAAFQIESDVGNGFVNGNVAVTITGNARISDLRASIPLGVLQQAIASPGLSGSGNLSFEEITIEDEMLTGAVGTVELINLVSPQFGSTPIGGYRMDFQSADDGVMASVEDTNGVLDVAGTFDLTTAGAYRLVAMVTAKAEASATLKGQLEQLGPANPRGQREVRIEGQL